MVIDETPGNYALKVDRGLPTGNSEGIDGRLALHVKIRNSSTEAIPVYTTSPPSPAPIEVIDFNEISSVPTSSTATLYSYTVLPAQTLIVYRVFVSGTNIATYELSIDAVVKARKRTYFSGPFSETFEFIVDPDIGGLIINSGSTIQVNVTNFRPDLGDFEATLIGAIQS